MPELDYRDVRRHEISVGDLVAFDTLMARLTDRERDTINRKIAYEVGVIEDAYERSRMEYEGFGSEEGTAARRQRKALDDEIAALKANVAGRANTIVDLDAQLTAVRSMVGEMEARHARELQEAEVRGFQRGRAEESAAHGAAAKRSEGSSEAAA